MNEENQDQEIDNEAQEKSNSRPESKHMIVRENNDGFSDEGNSLIISLIYLLRVFFILSD